MQIIFDILDEKAQRIVDAMSGIYPRPPEFSSQQWAKEKVRRFIVYTVYRYEQKIAMDQVKESILPDNDLVT